VRTTLRGALSWQSGINLLRASAGLGAKVFFNPDVQDQDVLVGQLNLDDRVQLGRNVELGVSGDYYDAGQLDVTPPCAPDCQRHRDFRTGSALVRLALVDEPGDVTMLGGYRGFEYKPDETFDFHAAQVQVSATGRVRTGQAEARNEWDLTASYHLERRWFSGMAEHLDKRCYPGDSPARDCQFPDPADPTMMNKVQVPRVVVGTDARLDWFHEASIELSYLRSVLITTGYALQLNQSTSYGQSLLRHILTLKVAIRLPWQLYATLKAQLLITSYLDPVLVAPNSQAIIPLEDENRNAIIAELERPFSRGLAMVARYSVFTNELSSTRVSFLRQVVYLGLTYRVASH
jgi:hypothetical protein